ncbi:MAG: hypothetical protein U9Q82_06920, partial [Chloroflexota bacterium]|nr:hypothetical protein [Chloroflexota bacterium]
KCIEAYKFFTCQRHAKLVSNSLPEGTHSEPAFALSHSADRVLERQRRSIEIKRPLPTLHSQLPTILL